MKISVKTSVDFFKKGICSCKKSAGIFAKFSHACFSTLSCSLVRTGSQIFPRTCSHSFSQEVSQRFSQTFSQRFSKIGWWSHYCRTCFDPNPGHQQTSTQHKKPEIIFEAAACSGVVLDGRGLTQSAPSAPRQPRPRLRDCRTYPGPFWEFSPRRESWRGEASRALTGAAELLCLAGPGCPPAFML